MSASATGGLLLAREDRPGHDAVARLALQTQELARGQRLRPDSGELPQVVATALAGAAAGSALSCTSLAEAVDISG